MDSEQTQVPDPVPSQAVLALAGLPVPPSQYTSLGWHKPKETEPSESGS